MAVSLCVLGREKPEVAEDNISHAYFLTSNSHKMKTLLSLLLCLAICYGCKKEAPQKPTSINVSVSISHGYGMILSLAIVNQNNTQLFNRSLSSDTSFSLPVSPGDILTATYNSNIVNEIGNNDRGDIKFTYGPTTISEAEGGFSFIQGGYSIPVTIPK